MPGWDPTSLFSFSNILWEIAGCRDTSVCHPQAAPVLATFLGYPTGTGSSTPHCCLLDTTKFWPSPLLKKICLFVMSWEKHIDILLPSPKSPWWDTLLFASACGSIHWCPHKVFHEKKTIQCESEMQPKPLAVNSDLGQNPPSNRKAKGKSAGTG